MPPATPACAWSAVTTAHDSRELPGRRRRARHRRLRGIRMARVSTPDFWEVSTPAEATAGSSVSPLCRCKTSSIPRLRLGGAWQCPAAAAVTTPASWLPAATTWWASTSRPPPSAAAARPGQARSRRRHLRATRHLHPRPGLRPRLRRRLGVHLLLRHRPPPPRRLRANDLVHPEARRLAAGLLLPHAPHRRRAAYPVTRAEVHRRFGPKFRFERAQPPCDPRAAAKAANGSVLARHV